MNDSKRIVKENVLIVSEARQIFVSVMTINWRSTSG